jgi:hypothetical protein
MAGAGIELSAGWSRNIARFGAGNLMAKTIMHNDVLMAASEGRREAQRLLDLYVYQAPLPTSAGVGYQRTGKTRRAVSIRGASWAGLGVSAGVYVAKDIANRLGFFYPFILNRGRTDINYAPRPFWTQMKALMRARRRAQGLRALREIKAAFSR